MTVTAQGWQNVYWSILCWQFSDATSSFFFPFFFSFFFFLYFLFVSSNKWIIFFSAQNFKLFLKRKKMLILTKFFVEKKGKIFSWKKGIFCFILLLLTKKKGKKEIDFPREISCLEKSLFKLNNGVILKNG